MNPEHRTQNHEPSNPAPGTQSPEHSSQKPGTQSPEHSSQKPGTQYCWKHQNPERWDSVFRCLLSPATKTQCAQQFGISKSTISWYQKQLSKKLTRIEAQEYFRCLLSETQTPNSHMSRELEQNESSQQPTQKHPQNPAARSREL